jgi:hypothetical protein
MNNVIKLPTADNAPQPTGQRLRGAHRSEKYQTVETSDLLLRLQEAFAEDLDFHKAKVMKGSGTRHAINIPIGSETTMRGDIIHPNITLINSYNAECALKILVGFQRLVCMNGMTIGEEMYSERIVHRVGDKIDNFLSTFEEQVGTALGQVTGQLQLVEDLSSQTILQGQALQVIRNLADDKVVTKVAAEVTANRYIYDAFRRYEDEQQKHTVFGLWNVLNEELRRTATTRTSAFRLLDRNNKLLPAILDAVKVA